MDRVNDSTKRLEKASIEGTLLRTGHVNREQAEMFAELATEENPYAGIMENIQAMIRRAFVRKAGKS